MYIEKLTDDDIKNFLAQINLELNKNRNQNQMLKCIKKTKKAFNNSENFIICFCDVKNVLNEPDHIIKQIMNSLELRTGFPINNIADNFGLLNRTVVLEDFFAYDSFIKTNYTINYYNFMRKKFGEEYEKDFKKAVKKLKKDLEKEKNEKEKE